MGEAAVEWDYRGLEAIHTERYHDLMVAIEKEDRPATKLVLIEPRKRGQNGAYGARILMTPYKGRQPGHPMMMDVGGMHNTEYVQEVVERLRVSQ